MRFSVLIYKNQRLVSEGDGRNILTYREKYNIKKSSSGSFAEKEACMSCLSRLIVAGFVFAFAVPSAAQENKPKSQWAPTVNLGIGRFNTDRTGSVLGDIFGFNEVDIRGRSWDIGATRGQPGHSRIRLAYTELRFEDGSSVSNPPFEANITRGTKIKGFKAEKVWRFGPSRWPVAPILSLHGGIGKISGNIDRTFKDPYCDDLRKFGYICRPDLVTKESAKEVFGGLEWLPVGGLGFGATADIGDYLTVDIKVYGLEFPGTYAGSVQLTYWPRRGR